MRIALFDMDLIAYRSAAVSEKRSIEVQHIPTSKTKSFNTRTEFKDGLKSRNKPFNPEDWLIKDIQVAEPESYAFQAVKQQVKSISEEVEAEAIEGYVGGKNNFRLSLDLPVLYKGNRTDMIRPLNLSSTKKYIINKYKGGLIEGHEVDDHVVIRFHELKQEGHDPVILTLDKDQNGCIGTKFYDWTKYKPSIIEVPKFGYLEHDKSKNKVRGLGLNFYCYQMLKGDTSDNYSPSDLHKQRYGDVAVVKYLNEAKTVNDLFQAVEDQYKKWFPKIVHYVSQNGVEVQKDYKDLLNLYNSAVYMLRTYNDKTDFYSLWKEMK